jgi:hypothetical protein
MKFIDEKMRMHKICKKYQLVFLRIFYRYRCHKHVNYFQSNLCTRILIFISEYYQLSELREEYSIDELVVASERAITGYYSRKQIMFAHQIDLVE